MNFQYGLFYFAMRYALCAMRYALCGQKTFLNGLMVTLA